MCAMNLADPVAQTMEWDGTDQYTNSIFVSGLYEIVGYFIDTLAANTAILRLQSSEDAPGSVLDADATFKDVVDKDYAARDLTATGTEMADGVTHVALSPDQHIIGPVRIRLSALQSDGSTGVTGTASDAARPIFRRM